MIKKQALFALKNLKIYFPSVLKFRFSNLHLVIWGLFSLLSHALLTPLLWFIGTGNNERHKTRDTKQKKARGVKKVVFI